MIYYIEILDSYRYALSPSPRRIFDPYIVECFSASLSHPHLSNTDHIFCFLSVARIFGVFLFLFPVCGP